MTQPPRLLQELPYTQRTIRAAAVSAHTACRS